MFIRNLIALLCGALFIGQLAAATLTAKLLVTPTLGLELAAIGTDLSTTGYAYIWNLPLASTCIFLSIIWFRKIDGFSKTVPAVLTTFSSVMVFPLGYFVVLAGLPVPR